MKIIILDPIWKVMLSHHRGEITDTLLTLTAGGLAVITTLWRN